MLALAGSLASNINYDNDDDDKRRACLLWTPVSSFRSLPLSLPLSLAVRRYFCRTGHSPIWMRTLSRFRFLSSLFSLLLPLCLLQSASTNRSPSLFGLLGGRKFGRWRLHQSERVARYAPPSARRAFEGDGDGARKRGGPLAGAELVRRRESGLFLDQQN